jgi:hypothetical protein
MPRFLVSTNRNVEQYGVGDPITYYHLECPNYFSDNLIAEGLIVESFRNKQDMTGDEYVWNKYIQGFVRKNENAIWAPENTAGSDISVEPKRTVLKKKKISHNVVSVFKF